jgi:hypothetical protein
MVLRPTWFVNPGWFGTIRGQTIRGQTGGVDPKTETWKMVTVLEEENGCHERSRLSMRWS